MDDSQNLECYIDEMEQEIIPMAQTCYDGY